MTSYDFGLYGIFFIHAFVLVFTTLQSAEKYEKLREINLRYRKSLKSLFDGIFFNGQKVGNTDLE